jgi:putative transposase
LKSVSIGGIQHAIEAQKGIPMIRTHRIPCRLPRATADRLNLASGRIYTGVLVAHYRVLRRKHIWLSEISGTKWSDWRGTAAMHAHSIDAAQQGFYKACATTRGLHKAGFTAAKFPHWPKKFRTTIWKNTAIKRKGDTLELSTGKGNAPIVIPLPVALRAGLRFLEVRLVYDKLARRYTWHIVLENGRQPKPAPGTNVVSVDLGEIHPAVVGDEHEATIVTCRQRRSESQGHTQRMAKLNKAIARKVKGSKRYNRLIRAKVRMKAKHQRVMRDLEHKISREVVNTAVEQKAAKLVIGDVRDVADGIDCGSIHNQRMSQWNHGKVRHYVQYKAEAEGIAVQLENEAYTTQTCPHCSQRHKPRGRTYRCPSCGFQAHRDVVGQINILSSYKHGEPGKIPAPSVVKYRIPHNLRVMRRCPDTGQTARSVAREQSREAAGL